MLAAPNTGSTDRRLLDQITQCVEIAVAIHLAVTDPAISRHAFAERLVAAEANGLTFQGWQAFVPERFAVLPQRQSHITSRIHRIDGKSDRH
jgi:hypothetical protein